MAALRTEETALAPKRGQLARAARGSAITRPTRIAHRRESHAADDPGSSLTLGPANALAARGWQPALRGSPTTRNR